VCFYCDSGEVVIRFMLVGVTGAGLVVLIQAGLEAKCSLSVEICLVRWVFF
jgi:hypothetical protein